MLDQQYKTNSRKSKSTQSPKRQKPGSTGEGEYYHIEVLPKTGFVAFRTQDVGKSGHIQRVAGKFYKICRTDRLQ